MPRNGRAIWITAQRLCRMRCPRDWNHQAAPVGAGTLDRSPAPLAAQPSPSPDQVRSSTGPSGNRVSRHGKPGLRLAICGLPCAAPRTCDPNEQWRSSAWFGLPRVAAAANTSLAWGGLACAALCSGGVGRRTDRRCWKRTPVAQRGLCQLAGSNLAVLAQSPCPSRRCRP